MLQIPPESTSTPTDISSGLPWVGFATANWQSALNGCALWNASLTDALTAFQGECATFAAQRAQEDFAFPAHLATCKSPTDIAHAYADYFAKASSDYQKQCAQLAKLGNAFAHTTADIVRDFQKAEAE